MNYIIVMIIQTSKYHAGFERFEVMGFYKKQTIQMRQSVVFAELVNLWGENVKDSSYIQQVFKMRFRKKMYKKRFTQLIITVEQLYFLNIHI